MQPPTTNEMLLAAHWIEHAESSWAWDEVRELMQEHAESKKFVQLAISYAPDNGTLAAIAAGPVEDLARTADGAAWLIEEASRSPRLRLCLAYTYVSDGPLGELVERCNEEKLEFSTLPVESRVEGTPEDVALLIAWLHHGDTSWAATLLDELTRTDVASTVRLLRILVRMAADRPDTMRAMRTNIFQPLIARQFTRNRDALLTAIRGDTLLTSWLKESRRPYDVEADAWLRFVEAAQGA